MSTRAQNNNRGCSPASKKRKMSDTLTLAVTPAPCHVYAVQSYRIIEGVSDHKLHSLHQSAALANASMLKVYNNQTWGDIVATAVTKAAPEEPVIEASEPESVETRKHFEKELSRQQNTGTQQWPRLSKDGGLRLGGTTVLGDMRVVWVQRWDVEREEEPIANEGTTVASPRTAPPIVQPVARTHQSLQPSTSDTSSFVNVELAHDNSNPGLSKASNADNMRASASKQKQPGTLYSSKPLPQQQAQTQPSASLAQPFPQQRREPELSEDMHLSSPSMQRAWLPPQVPAQVFPP